LCVLWSVWYMGAEDVDQEGVFMRDWLCFKHEAVSFLACYAARKVGGLAGLVPVRARSPGYPQQAACPLPRVINWTTIVLPKLLIDTRLKYPSRCQCEKHHWVNLPSDLHKYRAKAREPCLTWEKQWGPFAPRKVEVTYNQDKLPGISLFYTWLDKDVLSFASAINFEVAIKLRNCRKVASK